MLVSSAAAGAEDLPTLGRQTPGSSWFEMGSDYKRSSRFTLDRAATATDLVAYLDGFGSRSGSQQVRFAIYADSAGEPSTLLGQSVVGTVASRTQPAWVRLPLEAPVDLTAGAYHLAILSGGTSRVARYSREPLIDGLRTGSDLFADGASPVYEVDGSDDYEAAIYAVVVPRAGAPVNDVRPEVIGIPQVGETLTATTGTWSGDPTGYGYEWQRCDSTGATCVSIPGADRASYAVVAADEGSTLRVVVSAVNSAGTGSAASLPTSVVQAAPSREVAFGRQVPGDSWFKMSSDYKRASRFQLSEAGRLTDLVAYLDGNGTAGSSKDWQEVRFAVYSDVAGEPSALIAQTTVGAIEVGAPADWVKLPLETPVAVAAGAYHLAVLSGSTSGIARYSREQAPGALRTASDLFADGASALWGGTSRADYELAIYAVLTTSSVNPPTNTTPPGITGTPQVGQTLTASTGTWSGSPTRYAYEWRRCNSTGGNCSAISGATGAGYKLTTADQGSTIRVAVTATNEAGSATAQSPPTPIVAAETADTLLCDAYASPVGSDLNPLGTLTAPFRTVAKLISSLPSAGTGCLIGLAGAFPNENLTVGKPITLTSVPGQRAVFRGAFYLSPSANGTTLRDFDLDNSASPNMAVKLNADNVTISNMEITNNNKPNGTSNYNGICVLAGPGFENGDAYIVSNLVVERSRIHHCGDDAHEHSLYLEGTRNPIVRDNYFYGNFGLGLDLYPDTQGMIAEYNVIYGNSRGGKENVGFAGEVAGGEYKYDHASSNNIVRYNIITNAVQRYNVDSFYPSSRVLPTGNLVSENCVWNAPYGNFGYDNPGDYLQINNKDVDPQYVDAAAADFRLRPGSPCTGWGPRTPPAR